jgi:hypothetical protein
MQKLDFALFANCKERLRLKSSGGAVEGVDVEPINIHLKVENIGVWVFQ